ncbi:DsbA family protein [Lichenicoccus sp.]|uniref:DsbA family protein n=1 Tax=Lichenicoccus sp. TaxID=2781899 RepID=UPI003D0B7723
MRVGVVMISDFTCPWCFIGHAQLVDAIAGMPADIAVDADYGPFELNPGLPAEGMDRTTLRAAKFGPDRARALDARIMSASAGTGAVFNYNRMQRVPNTTLAHRLMQGGRSGYANGARRADFRQLLHRGAGSLQRRGPASHRPYYQYRCRNG